MKPRRETRAGRTTISDIAPPYMRSLRFSADVALLQQHRGGTSRLLPHQSCGGEPSRKV
jgi:hypothetical protein